jgi:hypothetical protein
MVSEGHNLWQGVRPGKGDWENVTRLKLTNVLSTLTGPDASQIRAEFLGRSYFHGMTPLLRSLRNRLVWARSETVRRADGEQIHLVGVWSQEQARKLTNESSSWPGGLLRQCHLYLDAKSFCPRRVEWWGPTVTDGVDRLLAQMEFRQLVFNRPLPDAECARRFAFQPGDVPIQDETASVTAELTKRAQQLAAQTEAH